MANEALERLVEMLTENPVVEGDTVEEMRASFEEKLGSAPRPEGVAFTPVDAGGVPAEWTEAPGAGADPDRTHCRRQLTRSPDPQQNGEQGRLE